VGYGLDCRHYCQTMSLIAREPTHFVCHFEKAARSIGEAPLRRLLSRGNPSPYTTFDHFFPWRAAWQTPPLTGAADAALFSGVWGRLCGRRTIHPSGSRLLDVSLARHTSAPGPCRAPENRRCPAVSNRLRRTHAMAPCRVPCPQDSRPRRRQTPQASGRPSAMGCGQNASNGMVGNPFSSPSPILTQPPARPQPQALWTAKGIRSRLMS
jgi:hypothetical protein